MVSQSKYRGISYPIHVQKRSSPMRTKSLTVKFQIAGIKKGLRQGQNWKVGNAPIF